MIGKLFVLLYLVYFVTTFAVFTKHVDRSTIFTRWRQVNTVSRDLKRKIKVKSQSRSCRVTVVGKLFTPTTVY